MKPKDFIYIILSSLAFGGWFAFMQPGSWLIGFVSFSFLLFLSFTLLKLSIHWAGNRKTVAWIVALAFALRLLVGVGIHLGLPVYGHDDSEDDKSGYIFTDAHIRDDQAWNLARSDRPILDAFSRRFSSDQYGGLLAFSTFVYRYLSPDAHRPLMMILLSAFVAVLGIPFLWKGTTQVFGEKVAFASVWIFALYPESILLSSSIMRESYLLMFSAMAFYGFVFGVSQLAGANGSRSVNNGSKLPESINGRVWFAVGLLGMLLVSPAIALVHLIIFAGWFFFTNENRSLSWKTVLVFIFVFIAGLLFLSASLNRSGQFDSTSPFHVINDWLKLTVKWDAYQLERDSGWIQKLFDEMPEWMRLPFVVVYGILQPVLPAALVAPTVPVWKVIYILRSLGWYVLLPALIMSFGAAAGQRSGKNRNIILWLSLLTWTWILLASLRGGGDSWDNPRYRTIMFVWESILVGAVWVWWHETHNVWLKRVVLCEVVFLLVFTQWYASRYIKLGGQLPFAVMVGLIAGLWGGIVGMGWWLDKKNA